VILKLVQSHYVLMLKHCSVNSLCIFTGKSYVLVNLQQNLHCFNPFMGTLKLQSNKLLYSNTVIGTLAVDGWTVIFVTARRGLGNPTLHVT